MFPKIRYLIFRLRWPAGRRLLAHRHIRRRLIRLLDARHLSSMLKIAITCRWHEAPAWYLCARRHSLTSSQAGTFISNIIRFSSFRNAYVATAFDTLISSLCAPYWNDLLSMIDAERRDCRKKQMPFYIVNTWPFADCFHFSSFSHNAAILKF